MVFQLSKDFAPLLERCPHLEGLLGDPLNIIIYDCVYLSINFFVLLSSVVRANALTLNIEH